MQQCHFIGLILCCCLHCRLAPPQDSPEFLEYDENSIKAWAYFSQGLQDEQMQNWKSAAVHFEKAATLSPRSPRAYTHLAWSLLHLDMGKDALAALELAENDAAPDDYLLYFDLGNVYRAAGRYQAARRCYRKSLEIFPHFEQGDRALSDLLAEMKRKE